MSKLRMNKSSSNLLQASTGQDDFETEFLLPTQTAAKAASTGEMPGSSSSSTTVLDMGDWSSSSRRSYTVSNGAKITVQPRPLVAAVAVTVMALLLLTYMAIHSKSSTRPPVSYHDHDHLHSNQVFNNRYPLTDPEIISHGVFRYQIALVSDLDTDSKVANKSNTWHSIFKRGTLTWDTVKEKADIEWTDEAELKGNLASGGRGLELSELVTFDGRLLTIDDRTGVIYQIHNYQHRRHPTSKDPKIKLSPWTILSDGNGSETKSFKGEWMTVKDEHLYVGGLGKEWTTSEGHLLNFNPMFVKRISARGEVEHLDWHDSYVKMRSAAGIEFPGYMIHEAVGWSETQGRWLALPRRASKYKYNDVEDERHGTNMLLKSDPSYAEDFSSGKVSLVRVGAISDENGMETHGFSSFKFVPGTGDSVIVALRSEEFQGKVASYIMVFKAEDGTIIYPETKVGDYKFEGVEFV